MIEIRKIQPPFVLTERDGARHTFSTRRAVLETLGYGFLRTALGEAFSADHVHTVRDPWGLVCRTVVKPGVRFVLTDARGRVLRAQDFDDLVVVRPSWYAQRYRFYGGTGPVPGTRKWKAGQHVFRSPQTMQARRLAVFADPAEAVAPARPCRKGHNLPSSWDDISSSAKQSRCWKGFRKTQYRTPKG